MVPGRMTPASGRGAYGALPPCKSPSMLACAQVAVTIATDDLKRRITVLTAVRILARQQQVGGQGAQEESILFNQYRAWDPVWNRPKMWFKCKDRKSTR